MFSPRYRRGAALLMLALLFAGPSRAAGLDDANAGIAALQRGAFAEAIPFFDSALADQNLPADLRAGVLAYRANTQLALGHADAAESDFQAVLKLQPEAVDVWTNLAILYEQKRDYPRAVEHHRKATDIAVRQAPTLEGVTAHNNIAFFLATCPDAAFRDGKVALKHARAARALITAHFPNASTELAASSFDTLSAAYAETGLFDEAVKAEEQAIAMLDPSFPMIPELKTRLEGYKNKKPWRTPSVAP